MPEFEPELGQAFFGQPAKKYEAPLLLIAALREIDNQLSRMKYNELGRGFDSPFENTGNQFKCDEFEVQAYLWNDKVEQKYNFKWKDIEVSWYKHFARGTSVNTEITPDKIQEMLEACIVALCVIEKKRRGV